MYMVYICILGQSSDNAPDDDDNENDIIWLHMVKIRFQIRNSI